MNKEVLEENALKDIGYILMKNDSKEKAYEYHEDDIGYCKVIKFEKLFQDWIVSCYLLVNGKESITSMNFKELAAIYDLQKKLILEEKYRPYDSDKSILTKIRRIYK